MYACIFACTYVCPSPFSNVCVCVCVCSAMCICMCGTVDQNRALTVAGLLLADACLEELTAARPVNHRACPLALYPHHPILLTLNLAGCCLYTVCVCVWWRWGAASFPLMCFCVAVLAAWVCFRQRSIKTKWSKTGASIAKKHATLWQCRNRPEQCIYYIDVTVYLIIQHIQEL